MKRFWKLLAAVGLVGAVAFTGAAQAAPTEGQNYKLLPKPMRVEHPNKIEVVEFFGYFCPHCDHLESTFNAWAKKQKADVVVRRIPVAFRPDVMPQVKLFYTLEALGKIDSLHSKVFDAYHRGHKRMIKTDELVEFATANGIDKTKFLNTFNSMAIDVKSRAAVKLVEDHFTESVMSGVPAVVVQGRYYVADIMGPDDKPNTQTLDYLVNEVRAKRK